MWKTKHVHWKITNRKAKQILMHAVRHGDKMICWLRELSCHIAGSKSRSPYIYEGLRPVEVDSFANIAKQKSIYYFCSSYVPFPFFRFFLFYLRSCLPSSEIAALGPVLVAASIKRDLDAT